VEYGVLSTKYRVGRRAVCQRSGDASFLIKRGSDARLASWGFLSFVRPVPLVARFGGEGWRCNCHPNMAALSVTEDDAERSWLSAFGKSRLLPHWVPALGRRGIRVPMCGCDGGDSPF
jgi:hypothetical protein